MTARRYGRDVAKELLEVWPDLGLDVEAHRPLLRALWTVGIEPDRAAFVLAVLSRDAAIPPAVPPAVAVLADDECPLCGPSVAGRAHLGPCPKCIEAENRYLDARDTGRH